MKRLILLILLVFAGFQTQGQVRFGIKGGMNMSSFDMSSKSSVVIDFSNRFAFHVGGLVEILVDGFFSVQPELLFSSKGVYCNTSAIWLPPTVGRGVKYIMKTTYAPCYIELPVCLKAGIKAGPGKFIVGVGP